MTSGCIYAVAAGFLGAAASLCAKLSLGADYLRDACESGLSYWTGTPSGSAACEWVRRTYRRANMFFSLHCVLRSAVIFLTTSHTHYQPMLAGYTLSRNDLTVTNLLLLRLHKLHPPLRLLCGGLLFSCNAIMWTFFSKALRHCSSSARATVTTTASSFIASAVLGRVIFGESHAALWWWGISFTLCGLFVLHGSSPQTFPKEEGKKDE